MPASAGMTEEEIVVASARFTMIRQLTPLWAGPAQD
jgi:hypothetical protein